MPICVPRRYGEVPSPPKMNNLRKREFRGKMKVQKRLEIYVSAGLSLGRHPRPQQFLAKKILTLLHQLSERSDSKSPHLRRIHGLHTDETQRPQKWGRS